MKQGTSLVKNSSQTVEIKDKTNVSDLMPSQVWVDGCGVGGEWVTYEHMHEYTHVDSPLGQPFTI